MTLTGLIVASIVVAVASLVQGAVGFGLVLVAAPIVTMIDPRLVPGPILVPVLALTVVMSLRDREVIDARGVGLAFVGRIPGSLIGAWLLTLLTPAALELVVAGTVLLAVAITGSGLRVPLVPSSFLGAGFLSGVMGTTTAIGGPPVAIVYQHAPGRHIRGTLSGFFVVGTLMSMAMLALVGRFGWTEIRLGATLLPATAVGYVAAGPAARVLDRGYTRLGVLAVSTAAALVLVARRVV